MKIGCYFGTFDPIHVGHLIIARYMLEFTDLEQLWLVVTPHNPLKVEEDLTQDDLRLRMVQCAVEEDPDLLASDIEFKLPKPNYTADTLSFLSQEQPNNEFVLIMGEDNLRKFPQWRDHDRIAGNYKIYVYPRALTEEEVEMPEENMHKQFKDHKNISFYNAPVLHLSATMIRESLMDGKDVRYMVTTPVYRFIKKEGLYAS